MYYYILLYAIDCVINFFNVTSSIYATIAVFSITFSTNNTKSRPDSTSRQGSTSISSISGSSVNTSNINRITIISCCGSIIGSLQILFEYVVQ